jgi:hypothetical protein
MPLKVVSAERLLRHSMEYSDAIGNALAHGVYTGDAPLAAVPSGRDTSSHSVATAGSSSAVPNCKALSPWQNLSSLGENTQPLH